VVTLAPSVAISVQGPVELVPRWTLKPVSLEELSVHCRSISFVETAVAVRPEGAAGKVVILPPPVLLAACAELTQNRLKPTKSKPSRNGIEQRGLG
jgi:hypothetical protein